MLNAGAGLLCKNQTSCGFAWFLCDRIATKNLNYVQRFIFLLSPCPNKLVQATFAASKLTMINSFGKLPSGTTKQRILTSKQFDGKQFKNELPTVMMSEETNMLKMSVEFFKPRPGATPAKAFQLKKSDLKSKAQSNEPEIIWFGHSSYLIHSEGVTILVDPVLSGNASPVAGMVKEFAGTGVYTADDFPEIDVLLITHDHYDHLDHRFVKQLKTKVKRVVCSLGVAPHLIYWGFEPAMITELDWDEQTEAAGFSIKAKPARHFSGRGLIRNRSLWSSFVLRAANKSIFLGGDSGYGPHFKRIGEQEGPFDVALLECGQYNRLWPQIHMQPEETVQAALDLGAKILMPVHWGKFKLALHDWDEPVERVVAEAANWQLPLLLPAIAERRALFQAHNQAWWRLQK